MSDPSENQPRPLRSLGAIRHSFPDMTPVEKAFVAASMFCGVVTAIVLSARSRRGGPEQVIIAICGCVMGPVAGYWIRQEPAAFLQMLLFSYSPARWTAKWPPVALTCVRWFGILSFFACLEAFPLLFLPNRWTSSTAGELVVFAFAVTISACALRKRVGVKRAGDSSVMKSGFTS